MARQWKHQLTLSTDQGVGYSLKQRGGMLKVRFSPTRPNLARSRSPRLASQPRRSGSRPTP